MITKFFLKNRLFLLAGIAGALQFGCQQQPAATATASAPVSTTASTTNNDWVYEGIEFDMPRVQEPTFGNYSVSITDFGAVSDGLTKNTAAFEKAIADVGAKGGGKVIVPRGMWLTGPIVLKSNINLHVEDGALVLFSKDFDDYPLVKTSFEGLNTYRCQSPISGINLENVAITGKGVFDGNGDAWRPVKKGKMTDAQWKTLLKSGGVLSEDGKIWYPSECSKRGDTKENFNVPIHFTKLEQFEPVK
ncbi:MAG: glycoside hydrolase family 28 protein, partial [Hymenobacteraceae bacterium]|nr:glycoside hydrolase family 28 protein [Hymenobacteraceae bacterium]